jgi:peptidoglycan/LPS O-acetylase OafA/YrhL
MSEPSAARGHLHAVDVVRFFTVGGVIAVHAISLTMPAASVAAGAPTILLHVNREVFVFLSAFVLAYSYRNRELQRRAFWRKRYPLVVVPLLMWSAIYILDRGWPDAIPSVAARFPYALAVGRYHLYFLLVTLQLYAVFPWLLGWMRRIRRPFVVLTVSAAAQLAFTAATHNHLQLPGLAGRWFSAPTSWLLSYQLYAVAGALAALHLDRVRAWVDRNRGRVGLIAGAGLGFGVVSYFVAVAHGATPLHASEVFQPAVTVESLAAIAGLYAFGLWFAERASARRLRGLERATDISFGVYLAHPLVLQVLWWVAGAVGVRQLFTSLPGPVAVAVVLAVLVPLAYVVTAGLVATARRTRLSLALTGRPRVVKPSPALSPAPSPSPVPAVVPTLAQTAAFDAAVLR